MNFFVDLNLQGGSEILESLGYTEYTGFALQYPRNIIRLTQKTIRQL